MFKLGRKLYITIPIPKSKFTILENKYPQRKPLSSLSCDRCSNSYSEHLDDMINILQILKR